MREEKGMPKAAVLGLNSGGMTWITDGRPPSRHLQTTTVFREGFFPGNLKKHTKYSRLKKIQKNIHTFFKEIQLAQFPFWWDEESVVSAMHVIRVQLVVHKGNDNNNTDTGKIFCGGNYCGVR